MTADQPSVEELTKKLLHEESHMERQIGCYATGPYWYHGTDEASAAAIMAGGAWSFGIAGFLGQGVYFSHRMLASLYGDQLVVVRLRCPWADWHGPLCTTIRQVHGWPTEYFAAGAMAITDPPRMIQLRQRLLKSRVRSARYWHGAFVPDDFSGLVELAVYDPSCIEVLGVVGLDEPYPGEQAAPWHERERHHAAAFAPAHRASRAVLLATFERNHANTLHP